MEAIATLCSAIIAALALIGWYFERRDQQLRKKDVLDWANECIQALQSIFLLYSLDAQELTDDFLLCKNENLIFETSILVERGRLLFRNAATNAFGSDKAEAYRGYRPEILDHLVVGHQLACAWRSADAAKRRKMSAVAEDHVKRFVSMVQSEVGRARTVSTRTAQAGDSVHLERLLGEIDDTLPTRQDR